MEWIPVGTFIAAVAAAVSCLFSARTFFLHRGEVRKADFDRRFSEAEEARKALAAEAEEERKALAAEMKEGLGKAEDERKTLAAEMKEGLAKAEDERKALAAETKEGLAKAEEFSTLPGVGFENPRKGTRRASPRPRKGARPSPPR